MLPVKGHVSLFGVRRNSFEAEDKARLKVNPPRYSGTARGFGSDLAGLFRILLDVTVGSAA